jgi:hypothetical protein
MQALALNPKDRRGKPTYPAAKPLSLLLANVFHRHQTPLHRFMQEKIAWLFS